MTFRLIVLLFRSQDLSTDPDAYIALAKGISEHGGLCRPGSADPTAFRPPLFPWLLSILMWIGLKSSVAIASINLASSGVLMIATWWMARVVGLRGIYPAIAALACAIDPLLLRYSSLPMTESLSAALLAVAVMNVLKTVRVDGKSDGNSAKSMIVSGIFFGLAGLCRPIGFVACALVSFHIAILAIADRRKAASACSITPRTAILLPMTAGFLLLPWVVRNAVMFGEFVPATSHGGYTLLLGNNSVFYNDVVNAPGQPVWEGASREAWQKELDAGLERDSVDTRSEIATDRWMYSQARKAIASDRSSFVRACLLRWKRFWALTPSVDATQMPFVGVITIGVWYAVIWLLNLTTLFSGIRQRRDIQILWIAILSFLVVHTFYWSNARMRAPLAGYFAVLGTLGLRNALTLVLRRNRSESTTAD